MSLKFLIYPILISLLMTTPTQAAPDHNILNQNDYILVKTRAHAEALAEVHIANVYGKTRATQQNPYQVQETPTAWVVSGSLKPNKRGGTFFIVINKQNGAVLQLTHGR